MIRFRIEDIVLPSSKEVAKIFECSICLGVVHDPVQTRCQHIFCRECLLRGSNLVCPLCKTVNDIADVQPLKDVNLAMYRAMGNIKVVCPYGAQPSSTQEDQAAKRRRTEGTCDWSGSYCDLLETHARLCDFAPDKCSYCKAEIARKDLAHHESQCEHRYETCPICGERMRDTRGHMEGNALRHVDILQTKFTEAGLHRLVLEHTIHELTRSMPCPPRVGEMFTFKVKGVGKLIRDYERGQSWLSPAVSGMWFRIKLFPNGNETSSPNHYALFVLLESQPRFYEEYHLEVKVGKSGGAFFRAGFGFANFGRTSQLSEDADQDELTIVVKVETLGRTKAFTVEEQAVVP